MINENKVVVEKKFLIALILFCMPFMVMGNAPQVSDQEIDSFNDECLSDSAVNDPTCLERYQRISTYVEGNTHLEAPNSNNVCIAKNGDLIPLQINDLAEKVDDLSSKLTCNEEDEEFVQDHCGKQMACNMGRSVVTIVENVAPTFITNKVRSSLSGLLSAQEGSSCMDGDQANCVSEIYRAFISSLVATFTSLRDIGVAIKGAFSNMRAYLFEKSEDLHAAADSTQSETTKFLDSPGKYILEKLSSFKTGIDTWIKETVFCQKWEGEPHSEESKCLEPLKGYGCLDCDDGINAFCAGAGFFISEGLLTVATAGTFTGLGIAARTGGKLARAASLRGAEVLTTKVPALAKLSSRGSRGARRSPSKGRQLIAAAANRYNRAKESVARFGQMVAQTRVGRATGAVANVVGKPLQVVDNLTNRTIEKVLGSASRISGTNAISRTIRQTAREDFRLIRRVNSGDDVASAGAQRATRGLSGARVTRVTNRRRSTSGRDREGRVSDVSNDSRGDRDSARSTGPEEQRDRSREGADERRRREEAERVAQDNQRREEQRREEQRREEKRREDERRSEEDNDGSGNNSPTILAARDRTNSIVNASRMAVVADLAAKGIRPVAEAASEAINDSTISSILSGEEGDQAGSPEEQVNQRTGTQFQDRQAAHNFINNMSDVYSDPSQRDQIINRLVEDKNLSRSQASRVYESEREFYRGLAQNTKQSSRSRRVLAQQKDEIEDLVSKLSEIKKNILIQESSEDPNEIIATRSPEQSLNQRVEESDQTTSDLPGPTTRRRSATRSFSPPALGNRVLAGTPSEQTISAPLEENESTSELAEAGPEEIKPEEQEKDGTQPPEASQALSENKEQIDASKKRMEIMEFLSLLLVEAETGKLSFRRPTATERDLVTRTATQLNRVLQIDHTQVVTLGGPNAPYYLFKDFQSNQTLVLDAEGRVLEGIPNDII